MYCSYQTRLEKTKRGPQSLPAWCSRTGFFRGLLSFSAAIAQHARIPLYFSFGLYINFLAGVPEFNAEAHVPAQPSPSLQDARFSYTNENKEWTSRAVTAARQRAQACLRKARIPRVTGLQVLLPL